ncbi:alpha/beta hydrolase [Paenibacillus sp. LjRoot153]|uniref:alpha/beta hydrolase n=1 Tax=Paenibacillus sp. LjRoot153 TaxID=3342270 RepID=UPI003F506533
MIHETHKLWEKEEYTYPVIGRFVPNVVTYIHDEDDLARPAIIIVPGGGYAAVAHSEGEIVAQEFFNKGYNAFVLTYTTNFMKSSPLKLQPLKDLSKAVTFVRKQAQRFYINPHQLTICGFSAGGHLCGSLAVHFDEKELLLNEEYEGISNRPDAVILSYPVITSGEYGHQGSFTALFGVEPLEEELAFMSLEKHVGKDTPPIFMWHTSTDEEVPVENSYLFANSCKEQGVPFELHVFGNGNHGLSLANEQWASGNYGGFYTMQQFFDTLEYLVEHRIELPAPFNMLGTIPEGLSAKDYFRQIMSQYAQQNKQDEGIAIWPALAHNWLKKIYSI